MSYQNCFSNDASLIFDLNDYSTKEELEVAISALPYIGGTTFTSKAIDMYLNELLGNEDRGNRYAVVYYCPHSFWTMQYIFVSYCFTQSWFVQFYLSPTTNGILLVKVNHH